jgi:hypothetical protein
VSSPPPRAHSPLLERTPKGPDSPLSAYGGSAPAGELPLQEIGAGTSPEARLREEVCSSACVSLGLPTTHHTLSMTVCRGSLCPAPMRLRLPLVQNYPSSILTLAPALAPAPSPYRTPSHTNTLRPGPTHSPQPRIALAPASDSSSAAAYPVAPPWLTQLIQAKLFEERERERVHQLVDELAWARSEQALWPKP